jgi:hypothetical protein
VFWKLKAVLDAMLREGRARSHREDKCLRSRYFESWVKWPSGQANTDAWYNRSASKAGSYSQCWCCMLRAGDVSVVIRRLVHHSWQGPAIRTRQALDRQDFLMSISISSLPR